MPFATLINVTARKNGQEEFSVLTPEELKAECDASHGVVPQLSRMTIRDNRTGEVTENCFAVWRGMNRRIGHEVNVCTAAGDIVHTFLTKRLESCGVAA